jgi:hypothetical protein
MPAKISAKRGARRLADGVLINRVRTRLDRHIDRRVDARVDRRLNSTLDSGVESGLDRLLGTKRRAGRIAESLLRTPPARRLIAEEVRRQLGGKGEQTNRDNRDFTLGVLLGARTPTKRTLSKANHVRLLSELQAISGIESADVAVTHAFRSLLDAETRGLGRIAGSPYNILGKLVVPSLLDLPDGPILEIGTLHGLFSPTLVRSLRRVGQFRGLTVVDPFTGHQMQGGVDIPTDPSGTPVYEHIARWNFRELGLADDEVRIVNGFSTDPEVQAVAGDRKYAIVIVDGDHFEDGVGKDLRWVETILAPGGIAILDDYGDPKWPGVEAATTKYLESGGTMRMRGRVWTSGYLQQPVAGADAG